MKVYRPFSTEISIYSACIRNNVQSHIILGTLGYGCTLPHLFVLKTLQKYFTLKANIFYKVMWKLGGEVLRPKWENCIRESVLMLVCGAPEGKLFTSLILEFSTLGLTFGRPDLQFCFSRSTKKIIRMRYTVLFFIILTYRRLTWCL